LQAAPHIQLVDSGRWYYDSEIRTEDALHPWITLRSLDNPGPFACPVGLDRPTAETLSLYDVVIWSSPQDSRG
jgi:hypothetical protein